MAIPEGDVVRPLRLLFLDRLRKGDIDLRRALYHAFILLPEVDSEGDRRIRSR